MRETVFKGEARVQLATAGSFFVAGLTFTSYTTFSTELSRAAELSLSQLGSLMSAFSFAYGSIQIVAGTLTARMRNRDILLLGLAIMCLSSLLFAFFTQYHWLLLLRVLMGIGAALTVPASTHILSERLAGPKLDRALGVFGSGWGLGTIFAFYVLTLVLPVGGYPWVMIGVAAAAALAAVPVLLFLSHKEDSSYHELAVDFRSLCLTKRLNYLSLIGLATGASYMAIVTWTPVYLESKLATGSLEANLMTGIVGFSLVAGAFLGGWLAAVLGRFPMALSTTILAFLLLLAMPAVGSQLLIASLMVLVGWIGFASFPAVLSTIPRLVPGHQIAAATGYVNGLGFALALISPFVVGLALDLSNSFTIAFLAAAPLTLLGVGSALVLRKELGWQEHAAIPARAP